MRPSSSTHMPPQGRGPSWSGTAFTSSYYQEGHPGALHVREIAERSPLGAGSPSVSATHLACASLIAAALVGF